MSDIKLRHLYINGFGMKILITEFDPIKDIYIGHLLGDIPKFVIHYNKNGICLHNSDTNSNLIIKED